MNLFLQRPPTGELPTVGLGNEQNLLTHHYYDFGSFWFEAKEAFQRPMPERFDEFRPFVPFFSSYNGLLSTHAGTSLEIEGPTLESVIGIVEEILQAHVPSDSGSFGIWSRGVYQILPDCFDTIIGFMWHPDPEAFAKCKAQEALVARRGSVEGLDGDHRWTRFDTVEGLLRSILKVHPGIKR